MNKRTKEKMSRIADRIRSQISHLYSNIYDDDEPMDEEVIVEIAQLICHD